MAACLVLLLLPADAVHSSVRLATWRKHIDMVVEIEASRWMCWLYFGNSFFGAAMLCGHDFRKKMAGFGPF